MKSTFTLLMFALLLLSCGSDKGSSPTRTTPPPPPVPSAAIQVMASGTITIHPSSDRRFGYATKFPIRIRETGGGSATWLPGCVLPERETNREIRAWVG